MAGEQVSLHPVIGDIVSLNGPDYYLIAHDGFGLPEVYRSEMSPPAQDGKLELYNKVPSRIVTLSILIYSGIPNGVWGLHQALMRAVWSRYSTLYLDVTDPASEEIYRLDVKYLKGLTLPRKADDPDAFQRDVLQFEALSPFWYKPEAIVLTFSPYLGGGTWQFPMAFPQGFGGDINASMVYSYMGTERSWPVINITGPADNVILYNRSIGGASGAKIDLSLYDIGDGEIVTINLSPGVKTITSDDGTPLLDYLSDDSDIIGFYLAPITEVVGGQNEIEVEVTNAAAATKVEFVFREYYGGI